MHVLVAHSFRSYLLGLCSYLGETGFNITRKNVCIDEIVNVLYNSYGEMIIFIYLY